MALIASTFLLFLLFLMMFSNALVSTEDSIRKSDNISTLTPILSNPHKKNRVLLKKSQNSIRRLKLLKKHRVAKYQIRKNEMKKLSKSSNKSLVNMKKSKPKFRQKVARKIRKPQRKVKDLMQNDETKRSDQPEGRLKSVKTMNNFLATLKKQKQKKIRRKAKKSKRPSNNKPMNLRKKSKSLKTNDTGGKLKAANDQIKSNQSPKPSEPTFRRVLKSSIKDGYWEEFHSKSTGQQLYRDEYGHIQHNGCWYKNGEEFLEARSSKTRICKSKAEVVRKNTDVVEKFINEYGEFVVKHGDGTAHVNGQLYEYGYGQYINRKRDILDVEEQRKRIRMHGGNPDKFNYNQICVREYYGKCYHEGPKHCVKRDWAKKCLKWYFFPQRYDDSGKIITLGRVWRTDMETPYEFENKPHYKSGRDKICVLGLLRRIPGKSNARYRCISFPKMFDTYPHLAKRVETEFPRALPKKHRTTFLISDQNRYRNGWYIKMNEKSFKGSEDALSIIEKMISGADDPKCEWIGEVLPFLQPHFKEFIEECTL